MKDNPKKAPDTKGYSAEKETLPWGLLFSKSLKSGYCTKKDTPSLKLNHEETV
jgi:hypothetical protein